MPRRCTVKRSISMLVFICVAAFASLVRADVDSYLLVPRYERGQRWIEVSNYSVEFHSSVQGQMTVPISVSTSERSKVFVDVRDADALAGDFRNMNLRFEYAFQEVVPPNHETKKIVNLPVHARTVHLLRRVDDLGAARMEVQIDGAALTPEIEGRFRARFANRAGAMPTQPVRVGESWTVSSDPAIESIFGERSSGTLQMQFASIASEEFSGKRCAVVKYTGDVVIRIPNVPGKDPRTDWEKRADKWNDREFQPIGGHGAATDYLHISGTIWIDLETRRPVRHTYSGTVEDDPDPNSPTNAKGTQIARQHGDVKFEWRSKPVSAADAARNSDGNIDGPPQLSKFVDPQNRFEIRFAPTWAANRDGGDTVKIAPGGETSTYAIVRAERVEPGTTPEAAFEKLVTPRINRLPNFVSDPAQPMELGNRAATSAFYRFTASDDASQPGTKFSASTNVTTAGEWALVIECVAPIDRFPDVAPQFAELLKGFKVIGALTPSSRTRGEGGGKGQDGKAEGRSHKAEAQAAAYTDPQDLFRLLDLGGFTKSENATGDDLLVLHAQDAQVRVRIERRQPDARSVMQRILRRAAEVGDVMQVVHEGAEGDRYIAIVASGVARQRVEVMPAKADGDFLVLTASAPTLESYKQHAGAFERVLNGCRP